MTLHLFLKHPLFWLLLLCTANFLAFLGGHALWDIDEPKNAVCAREMLLAGNWWVPMFNGEYRFDKPILIYWLMMPFYSLFGVNEWSARLPSALSMTGLVVVIWWMTRRLLASAGSQISDHAALMAAALFATSLHIMIIARAAVPDALLMLSLGIALPAMLIAYLEQKNQARQRLPAMLLLAYIAIGFGTLAKGPVAGLMPMLIVATFLTLMRDWKNWHLFFPFKGAAIALAIALPWYITVGLLTDGIWLENFIFHQNLDRFTDPMQGHGGFPGYYLLSILLGWFPWTGLVLAILWLGSWRLSALRLQPIRLFMLCWLMVYIVFFTLASTTLPNYVLPAYAAIAILIASDWVGLSPKNKQCATRWLLWTLLLLAAALMISGVWAVESMWTGEGYTMLFLLPVLLVAMWWLWRQKGELRLWIVGGMSLSMLLLTGWTLPAIDHHKISKSLAAEATSAGFDGSALAIFDTFQPTILFYHGGRLPRLNTQDELQTWLNDGKAVVIREDAMPQIPTELRTHLVVHTSMHGLYAKTKLLLISLPAKRNDIPWSEKEK